MDAVEIARHGLAHLTIHASEPPGLGLIADALDCGAERIGHGVRLIEDVTIDGGASEEGLVDLDLDRVHLGPLATYVRDRQIPLELAPTCNVQIGAVPSIAHHPVALFHRLGHPGDDQHRQPADERRAGLDRGVRGCECQRVPVD